MEAALTRTQTQTQNLTFTLTLNNNQERWKQHWQARDAALTAAAPIAAAGRTRDGTSATTLAAAAPAASAPATTAPAASAPAHLVAAAEASALRSNPNPNPNPIPLTLTLTPTLTLTLTLTPTLTLTRRYYSLEDVARLAEQVAPISSIHLVKPACSGLAYTSHICINAPVGCLVIHVAGLVYASVRLGPKRGRNVLQTRGPLTRLHLTQPLAGGAHADRG